MSNENTKANPNPSILLYSLKLVRFFLGAYCPTLLQRCVYSDCDLDIVVKSDAVDLVGTREVMLTQPMTC